jgi:phosphatidylserine/phosphatidylglycerophosphate/cardiolipin synthase-like enzyme
MTGLADVADTLDCWVGDHVESAVRMHHRRRLARIGQAGILDTAPSPWSLTAPPPRTGHEIEIFVDGGEALPEMVRALRDARERVFLAGWFFSASFELERGPSLTLGDLLRELGARVEVYVLAWAGAPLPLFRPGRSDVVRELGRLGRHPGVRVAADSHERPMHCHHEKLVIIDDRRAFIGGIDLTDFAGDRFDLPGHPNRGSLGWHDATSLVEGPVARDAAAHFRFRWHEVTGKSIEPGHPPSHDDGAIEAQLVRTVPEKIYRALPRGEFTILEAYLGALRSAQRLIYLENQFLWSSEVAEILRDKLLHPPNDSFRLVLVLPVRPNNGADDTRGQLGVLTEADGGAGRLLACTLYTPGGPQAQKVYVHAKIGIIDDRWLTLGSANLNEHSLFNDTEVNVVVNDESLATSTRQRLFAEHLELPREQVAGDPRTVIDERWRPVAQEQLDRLEAGAPLTHRLVRLPHVSRRSKRLLGPVQSLLVDG